MDKLIQFEIVTPEREVLREKVIQVTVPTKEGEITVLPNHIPLVAVLVPGVIEVKTPKGGIEVMAVSGGFIEVLKDKVVILADTAERAEEIDIERAEEARKRAEELKLKDTRYDREQFTRISALIEKEIARTRAAKRYRRLKSLDGSK
jgi:F-type H+-transporting ATPase subunit epsilon